MTQHKGGEMMLRRMGLRKPRPATMAGRALYDPVMGQARRPVFYLEGAVPDTPTGRFELAALHLALVERRLRREGAFGSEVGQALFDTFLSNLDAGLRELGVGDLTVPKAMRRLAEALYGRFKGLDEALAVTDDLALVGLIGRTVYPDGLGPITALAAYVRAADAALAGAALDDVLAGVAPWPEPVFAKAPA